MRPPFTLRPDLLQQPGHVPPQLGHGRHPFFVPLHFADVPPHTDIPVARPGDDHLGYEEEVVDCVEGVDGAAAADSHHRCPHLAPVEAGVGPADHADPVDDRLGLGGDVGEIGGGGDDHAVGLDDPGDALIDDVAAVGTDGAAHVPAGKAAVAGGATANDLAGELDHAGLDPLLLQFLEDVAYQEGGVAVPAGAAVDGDDFHGVFLSDGNSDVCFMVVSG